MDFICVAHDARWTRFLFHKTNKIEFFLISFEWMKRNEIRRSNMLRPAEGIYIVTVNGNIANKFIKY